MENEGWAAQEFREVELGDKRRTKRLIRLAEERSVDPNGSIAESCDGKADTKAAYRFLDNDEVGAEAILEGHYRSSIDRAKAEPIVLAVQDTTELNYTSHPATKGMGYLQGATIRGMLVHSTLLVTPQRVPLGLIDQQVWVRPDEEFKVEREKRRELPTEKKESQKWLVSLEATARFQRCVGKTWVINVGDSEADIFDLFQKARELEQELLIRATENRIVDHEDHLLMNYLQHQPVVGELLLDIPRHGKQPARKAQLEIRFTSVSICQPLHHEGKKKDPVQLWAIWAKEVSPSSSTTEPIQWLLLTTIPIESLDQACMCMSWYSCRWVIETYHKVLKSGCRVEERQFGDTENLQRYLALDAVVAWRVLFLTMLGRNQPELLCTIILDNDEWQALYCFLNHTRQPPQKIPSLQEATRWIAQLGGFLGRKSDGFPGSMSIWRGLQRLSDITEAWKVFHVA